MASPPSSSPLRADSPAAESLPSAVQLGKILAPGNKPTMTQYAKLFATGRVFSAPSAEVRLYKRLTRTIVDFVGVIGVGKSEAVAAVCERLERLGLPVHRGDERFNDLTLGLFGSDQKRYAFAFQVEQRDNCAASHAAARRAADAGKIAIVERGSLWSNVIFAAMHSLAGNIDAREMMAYAMPILKRAPHEVDLCVYVYAPPRVCLENIRKRGREAEKGLTLGYLEELDRAHYLHLRAQLEAGCNAVVVFNWPYRTAEEILAAACDEALPELTRQFFSLLPQPPEDISPAEIERHMSECDRAMRSK